MADTSDSSFSYIDEEDNEHDSLFYETYVEGEILVDFGDDHTEIMDEITELNRVAVVSETTDSGVVGNEAAIHSEAQMLANNSKIVADVWRFFTRKEKVTKDQNETEIIERFILCNVGQCQLSPNNSTSTLERHLKARHHNAYIELYEKRTSVEPWSAEIQKAKHEFFINWIVIDQQPFTIVNNLSFKKFMSSVQPKYKLPSRNTLKEMIMKKFETVQTEVLNYLQLSTSKVSLTIDMWTSISALGILAITIHYINENWQLEHFVLDVSYVPSPHDASTIKSAVLKITDKLNITSRLIGITTDNEVKMLSAVRKIKENLELPNFQHYRCTAHVLNLVVKAGLETDRISTLIKKLRVFISTVRNSPKQMDKLKDYFKIESVPIKAPLPDIVTRWNYTYYMLERAIEIKPFLYHLVANLLVLTNNWPTNEEWLVLNDLLDLLAPFALITKVISTSSYPMVGEVKWLFLGIKNHLEKPRDNYSLQDLINSMKDVFDHYFEQINYSLHIPGFFDPRYKKSAYKGMTQEDIFKPIQTVMNNYKKSDITSTEDNTIQNLQYQFNNLSASETRSYFQTIFMPDDDQDQQSIRIENELEIYFSSNPPSLDIMPLEWWKIHSSEYPILSQMAKDYLAIMSTSVPCEQLFSIAGKQITQTRNRLDSDTIRACLCLKSWLEQGIIN
jgi:hAT family C-terminal dimerisation region/Domain of unknown function (DUF4413)